nr:YfeC-like transcriptional regulator [Citrobacter sp. JGM124]
MTPEELAIVTGYSRQTINKWVRRQNWTTSPKPGVQGGKARLIHIDEHVRDFINSARRVTESQVRYNVNDAPLENLLLNSLQQMSDSEQQRMAAILLRDGIAGVLMRLGIRDE